MPVARSRFTRKVGADTASGPAPTVSVGPSFGKVSEDTLDGRSALVWDRAKLAGDLAALAAIDLFDVQLIGDVAALAAIDLFAARLDGDLASLAAMGSASATAALQHMFKASVVPLFQKTNLHSNQPDTDHSADDPYLVQVAPAVGSGAKTAYFTWDVGAVFGALANGTYAAPEDAATLSFDVTNPSPLVSASINWTVRRTTADPFGGDATPTWNEHEPVVVGTVVTSGTETVAANSSETVTITVPTATIDEVVNDGWLYLRVSNDAGLGEAVIELDPVSTALTGFQIGYRNP